MLVLNLGIFFNLVHPLDVRVKSNLTDLSDLSVAFQYHISKNTNFAFLAFG